MKTIIHKLTGSLAIAVAMSLSSLAQAMPTNIIDVYTGGNDNNYGDVISSPTHYNTFNISSMDVNIIGNKLYVDINTGFAGQGDDLLASGYTYSGKGIGYGDLFLSSSWTPCLNTACSEPYKTDKHDNGTLWEYGFSLDDRWMNESSAGTGTLYSLGSGNNNTDALLSQDFIKNTAIYRDGQEVAVDKASADVDAVGGNNSSWKITNGVSINFIIDLTGTNLMNSDTIALHWGMTCANDTIEGEYTTVPEPAMLALLVTGLFGIGFSRRLKA